MENAKGLQEDNLCILSFSFPYVNLSLYTSLVFRKKKNLLYT